MGEMFKKASFNEYLALFKDNDGSFWLSGLAWHVKPFADCFGIFFKNTISFNSNFFLTIFKRQFNHTERHNNTKKLSNVLIFQLN